MEESTEVVKKPRLSFFNPSLTVSNETIIHEPSVLNYLEIIKKEKEGWKKLYDEIKAKNKALIKKFNQPNNKTIEMNMFIEDELNFLNNSINLSEFARDAQELENLIKVIDLRNKELAKRKKRLVMQLERATSNYRLE